MCFKNSWVKLRGYLSYGILTLLSLPTLLMQMTTPAFCDVTDGNANVSFASGGTDATEGMSKGVNVVCGIASVVGALMAVAGIAIYLQAKQADDSREMAKAIGILSMGCVLVIAPSVVKFIFLGTW